MKSKTWKETMNDVAKLAKCDPRREAMLMRHAYSADETGRIYKRRTTEGRVVCIGHVALDKLDDCMAELMAAGTRDKSASRTVGCEIVKKYAPKKVKFTADELFEIATDEYKKAGLTATADGVGEWALRSADQEYLNADEVRAELRGFIKEELANLPEDDEK